MKATLLTPKRAEQVLKEKARKTKKSQTYYDRNAKDLNLLKPGDIVRIKPQGLVKGQEWRKGSVVQSHGYRSYDVKIDKVLRRNRVHLKPDKQGKAPTVPSDGQKPSEKTAAPAQKSANLSSTKQTPKTTKTAKPANKLELITAKRTHLGRLVKVPALYSL